MSGRRASRRRSWLECAARGHAQRRSRLRPTRCALTSRRLSGPIALQTYALALDGSKRPCVVRSSNAGQCLLTGIARPDRARAVAESLLEQGLFSGWGIRTIDASEARYNPMSYHNGSVWPHDNALIAAGFARYGFADLVGTILTALLDASRFFESHRIPELFCGFHKRRGEGPTLYPVACSPQAWAAGSVFLLLQAALGLTIDAPNRASRSRALDCPSASIGSPSGISWSVTTAGSICSSSAAAPTCMWNSSLATRTSSWPSSGDRHSAIVRAVTERPPEGYYGLPALKAPVWTWEIPSYFFVGGAAGAAAVIASAARFTGGDPRLVRDARWIAAVGGVASPALLIGDLGRPERFLNMLRVFKLQSPMSVGAWTLVAFSNAAAAAACCDAIDHASAGRIPVRIIGNAAEALAAASGLVLSTYTGVLIGATAIPVWSQNVRILPLHFGASGVGSAVSCLN